MVRKDAGKLLAFIHFWIIVLNMVRFLSILVALFISPFLLYEIFVWWRAKYLAPELGKPIYPWAILSAIGLVLVLCGFLGLSHYDGAEPGSRYIPAHMNNGVFVPGRFEKP